jgi:hypothetical protein
MDWDLTQVRKDTTRPSNVFYGINWGYRADETIEKSLDTGDLLFFSYECDQCFTPEEVIMCKKDKFTRSRKAEDPQNVAFCFRTPQKLLVVHSDMAGDIKIEPYNEFLNKPYLNSVKARQIIDAPSNIVQISTRFVEEL